MAIMAKRKRKWRRNAKIMAMKAWREIRKHNGVSMAAASAKSKMKSENNRHGNGETKKINMKRKYRKRKAINGGVKVMAKA